MVSGFDAIPEAVLAERAAAVEADTALLADYSEGTRDDPTTRLALLCFIVLDRRPELLADLKLSDEDLLWNRYYWFLRLKRLHELIDHDGKECDPMAQQAFEMLPDSGNFEPYPDIVALARRGAEAHFQQAGSSRKKRRKKKP
jgi:hypothetical protein